MPSLIEAFGIVFLEAMAAGIPVIGSNTGGIPELVKDGENGFLVDPDNHIELTQKILKLLNDDALRTSFINSGFQCVKNYSADKMVSDTIAIYQKIQKTFNRE